MCNDGKQKFFKKTQLSQKRFKIGIENLVQNVLNITGRDSNSEVKSMSFCLK